MLSLSAREMRVYCWQHARFQGDEDFWRRRTSDPSSVKTVKDGGGLRFFLTTAEDFKVFERAATQELAGVSWIDSSIDAEDEALGVEESSVV